MRSPEWAARFEQGKKPLLNYALPVLPGVAFPRFRTRKVRQQPSGYRRRIIHSIVDELDFVFEVDNHGFTHNAVASFKAHTIPFNLQRNDLSIADFHKFYWANMRAWKLPDKTQKVNAKSG
jgi:hypothetical protein